RPGSASNRPVCWNTTALSIPAKGGIHYPLPMHTRVLPFTTDSIAEAARLILAGEPVAVPTETVYGLAADATYAEAVTRIYEAKGRPSFNPLIVHIFDLSEAERIGDFDDAARALARQHWPGPLTIVVPLRA